MKNNSEKRSTYDICSDVLTGSRSSSQQLDISDGPIRSVADLSPPHREVSAAAVRSPRRLQRAAAADRQRLTSPVTTVAATVGNGVLKEEPVQFPVTIHTAAAYFVTTIKLYATFSIYFRVRCFIASLLPSVFPIFPRSTRTVGSIATNLLRLSSVIITALLCLYCATSECG